MSGRWTPLAAALLLLPGPAPAQEPNRGGRIDTASTDPSVALARFELAEGYEIGLFASERDFDIANPVAMAFDDRGRLWVLTMPTYPQYDPFQGPPDDKLLILEDTDGDGAADRQTVFARGLHVPTGFELGDGGAYVAEQPDLLFLADTDGDDRADVRRILLHGFGTEDSHHAISAFTWTNGGGLCFQEGTFFHTQVETPWGPVRLFDGGVFRYEPRRQRLEVLASYPFANPWGHVFDRFGQNFVADASGGANYFATAFSGHVDHPRKHAPMRTFTAPKDRVRPTCGIEFVSSRAFPPEAQGDWLLTNTIGFRGVLQFRMVDAGSGFRAEKVGPLLSSNDPNFRPVHVRFGPDGALYVADWFNPLIGHMQYSVRDPRRDHEHGRIWRVTWKGRTISPQHPAGRTLAEKPDLLAAPEDRTRYRARRSLRGHDTAEVLDALALWIAELPADDPEHEHRLLEALWVQQSHHAVDRGLLRDLLRARDPRVRAAATRVLRYEMEHVPGALGLLRRQARDPHPRVRLEAVVAASDVPDARGVDIALEACRHGTDAYLEYALRELVAAREDAWRAHLAAGRQLCQDNPEGAAWLLARAPTEGLLSLPRGAAVYRELLSRDDASPEERGVALEGLAALEGRPPAAVAVAFLAAADPPSAGAAHGLGRLLAGRPPDEVRPLLPRLAELAVRGPTPGVRAACWVPGLTADPTAAWREARRSARALADALAAVPLLDDPALLEELRPLVRPLAGGVPPGLAEGPPVRGRYVRIELPGDARTLALAEVQVLSGSRNVAREGRPRQSTTDDQGDAANAIDGDTEGRLDDDPSVALTEPGEPDPFWEVDLGGVHAIDHIVVWNCSEDWYAANLEGYTLRVLDEERRAVFVRSRNPAPPAHRPDAVFRLAASLDVTAARRAAVAALAAVPGHDADTFRTLAALVRSDALRDAALTGLLMRDPAAFPPEDARALAALLADLVAGAPLHTHLEPAFGLLVQAARHLRGAPGAAGGAATGPTAAADGVMARGRALYAEHCARCHQPDGRGLAGAFPPLASSPWLDLDDARVVKIVLHGMAGPVTVAGETYDAEMLPLGPLLDDEEVAAVVTYVRNAFGNRGPRLGAGTVAAVRRAHADREAMWTPGRLLADHPLRPPPHVCFVTGDEEYRSEESMPMLAAMLRRELGARVSVCYPLAPDGTVDPDELRSITGLEALVDADLMVLFTRFRRLPDDQLRAITGFAASGRPLVGFRTATHAFRYPAGDPRAAEMNAAWPARVFGQHWITHHGHFGDNEELLTEVTPAPGAEGHPILRGVHPFRCWSWLYHVDGNGHALRGDARPLLIGRALRSKAVPRGYPERNPVAWTKTHTGRSGRAARVFFATTAHPYDFKLEPVRKLALNGILWALGLEDRIPPDGVHATPVGLYDPNPSGFGDVHKRGLRPRFLPVPVPKAARAAAASDGSVTLEAAIARLDGGLRLERKADGVPNVGFWTGSEDQARFAFDLERAGRFRVEVWLACPPGSAGGVAVVSLGEDRLRLPVPSTGSWARFRWVEAGTLEVARAGPQELVIRPGTMRGALMNLRAVRLTPLR